MNQCKLQIADTFDIIGTQKLYNMAKCWKYILQQGKMIYGSDFILTRHHKDVLHKLLIYAIEDESIMQRLALDPKKGILLMGEPATGKTAMIRLVKPFFARKKQYEIKTCRVLSQDFSLKGYEMIAPLFTANAKVIVLDNLGKENIAKHYGQTCNVIHNIIEHFYEQRYDLTFPRVHITTTLSPADLERKYGIGFRKMFTEMFNVIVCE